MEIIVAGGHAVVGGGVQTDALQGILQVFCSVRHHAVIEIGQEMNDQNGVRIVLQRFFKVRYRRFVFFLMNKVQRFFKQALGRGRVVKERFVGEGLQLGSVKFLCLEKVQI